MKPNEDHSILWFDPAHAHAHGGPDRLCDGSPLAAEIYRQKYKYTPGVGDTLGNLLQSRLGRWPKVTATGRRFRFVYLQCCEAGHNYDWPFAFGMPHHLSESQIIHGKAQPQAFVGWKGDIWRPMSDDDFQKFFNGTMARFFDLWMKGTPLFDCLAAASDRNQVYRVGIGSRTCPLPVLKNKDLYPKAADMFHPKPVKRVSTLKIFGYPGITRSGYALGYHKTTL